MIISKYGLASRRSLEWEMKMFSDRKKQLGFFSGEIMKGGGGDCLFARLVPFPLFRISFRVSQI